MCYEPRPPSPLLFFDLARFLRYLLIWLRIIATGITQCVVLRLVNFTIAHWEPQGPGPMGPRAHGYQIGPQPPSPSMGWAATPFHLTSPDAIIIGDILRLASYSCIA